MTPPDAPHLFAAAFLIPETAGGQVAVPPDPPTLLKGGSGAERHGPILWLGGAGAAAFVIGLAGGHASVRLLAKLVLAMAVAAANCGHAYGRRLGRGSGFSPRVTLTDQEGISRSET